MFKQKYDEKRMLILNDRSKFQPVTEENTLDRHRKFQSFPRYHHKRSVFCDSDYSDIFPTGTNIPILYGLPKTHKPGVPLKTDFINGRNLQSWFSSVDWSEVGTSENCAKDSLSLHYLRDSSLGSQYFVSYDVVSLFTNIPLDETISHIVDTLYPKTPGISQKDQQFEGMTRTVFRRTLDWCVRNNVFIFSGKYYKHICTKACNSSVLYLFMYYKNDLCGNFY